MDRKFESRQHFTTTTTACAPNSFTPHGFSTKTNRSRVYIVSTLFLNIGWLNPFVYVHQPNLHLEAPRSSIVIFLLPPNAVAV
jgi:hypothetical protein